jgi:hypothetical protein
MAARGESGEAGQGFEFARLEKISESGKTLHGRADNYCVTPAGETGIKLLP